ncbi:MAG: PQQ-binding-like beta-propeller repeat protein [Bryobacteraceae bacterium]
MTRRELFAFAPIALAQAAAPPLPHWRQWGGPNRNFQLPGSAPIKSKWSAAGPKLLWRRRLGEGYSSPSVDSSVLYCMYQKAGREITIAANAGTGETIWEQSAATSFRSAYPEMGQGPYATPLIADDRIVTAGVTGLIECRARKDGALLWKHDLWRDHGGSRLDYGYSSSPIAFRNLVIVPCGGKGKSLIAFKLSDGSVDWAANDFPNAYSSPVLIRLDGLEQLVMLLDGALIAVNPHNGDLQWRVPFKASYGIAVATPLWLPGDLLFISAEYDAGAKMIRLRRNGLKTTATEVWSANRLRLHHGNAIHIDGMLYFSSGGKGSVAVLTAVDAATGKIHWQSRALSKATFLQAGDKVLALEQDGVLHLCRLSPGGFESISKAVVLSNNAWTPAALAGTKLYLRDRRELAAVELG